MNILFKKLFRRIPPEKEAKFLTEVVTGSAYSVFLDRHFREMVSFEKQKQIEQDRIFNELVVTGLLLLLSAIKDRLSEIGLERQGFWQRVYQKIPAIFLDWLSEIGIAKKYVDIWQKLIDLRLDEYKEKQTWTRQAWVKELLQDKDTFTDAAVRVETLTVSSMLHITRGKAKRNNPLRKHLRTWLSVLNNKLERRIGW